MDNKTNQPLHLKLQTIVKEIARYKYTPLILCVIFLINGLTLITQLSGTCDELGAHIPSGYLYWESGEFSGGINNPPLGQLLVASAAKMVGVDYSLFTEQFLFLFRLPVLLLGLLLAVYIYKFALLLFDRETAVIALLIYSFSPNIMAHTTLATLDLQIACFVFISLYYFFLFLQPQSPDTQANRLRLRHSILCFLFLGFSLATKIQAVLLLPIILLIALSQWKNLKTILTLKTSFLYLGLMVVIPIAVINIVYLNLPLVNGPLLPLDFVAAVKGKLLHGQTGHFSYLLGNYSTTGWWYFFPLVILFKTPLSTLLFFCWGFFQIIKKPVKKPEWHKSIFLLLPLIVFLGAAMKSGVNIGIRHLLIIYPLIFILAAYGAVNLLAKVEARKVGIISAAVLIFFFLFQTVLITPHQLSFFNVLAGGSSNGHKILIDSNYDWGQNDYSLMRYLKKKNKKYKINPNPFEPCTGDILVNINSLYGVLNGGAQAYTWLKQYQPVNRIAYTWLEYHIPAEDLPKLEQFRKTANPDNQSLESNEYLETMQRDISTVTEAEPHLDLAVRFMNQGLYTQGFDELRHVLKHHPTNKRALYMGGEIIVRFKLGVLQFKEDEYIRFFKPGMAAYAYLDKAKPTKEEREVGNGPTGITVSNASFENSTLTFTLQGYQRAKEKNKKDPAGNVEVTLTITAGNGRKMDSKRNLNLDETESQISMKLNLPPSQQFTITITARDIQTGRNTSTEVSVR